MVIRAKSLYVCRCFVIGFVNFSDIDIVKVCYCMIIFDFISLNDIFGKVLDSFYTGKHCEITLKVMHT